MHPVSKDERGGYYRLDPIPTDDELSVFYESRYYDLIRRGGRAPELRKLTAGGETAERELKWLHDCMYTDIAETFRERFARVRSVLDVGAGTGEFVHFLRGAGFEAEGIEPAREPAEAARQRGLPIHTANLAQWAGSAERIGSYDAIVMLNVLEHVPDPHSVILSCRELLKPGGVLVVRVPNDFSELQKAAQQALGASSWWICAPDHINYFNVETLRGFLGRCGMHVEHEMTDFPMEMFLLMGENYVANPSAGASAHGKRVQFELSLPSTLRRKLYAALAQAGAGRNIMTFARKPA